jgi:copper homeostasis protein CutC
MAAEDGGADRLELVRNLELEGLTPSLELTEQVLSRVSNPSKNDGPGFDLIRAG